MRPGEHTHNNHLSEAIVRYRHDCLRRGQALFFSPLPHFILIAHGLPDEQIIASISTSIDDGYGDPIDLDPADEVQTARLESSITEKDHSFAVSEFVTIDFIWPQGRQMSLCNTVCEEMDFLLIYKDDEIPAFQAIAAGSLNELLAYIGREPEVLLPLAWIDDAQIDRVIVHRATPWTITQMGDVVRALTGITICDDQICRTDLLLNE